MKYYDKLIFELSHPGRIGYSLPNSVIAAETDAAPKTCCERANWIFRR